MKEKKDIRNKKNSQITSKKQDAPIVIDIKFIIENFSISRSYLKKNIYSGTFCTPCNDRKSKNTKLLYFYKDVLAWFNKNQKVNKKIFQI